ncbi:uncharacterized protein ARMOST_12902 [Armillaria ostoyae]|uniref:Uncharacterized protein n=1 Tax=Armillaria ostoyae TaxID=47428 RepID=A0A284RL97_ARMOS|nr:uncharacterized protein ARMOST_12902 [Armillaria ostoyae]
MTGQERLYLLHAPAPSPSLAPRRRYEEWNPVSLDLKDVGEAECLTTPAIGGARATGTTSKRRPSGPLSASPTRRSPGGVTILLISIVYNVAMASIFSPPQPPREPTACLSSFRVSGTRDRLDTRYDGHLDLTIAIREDVACMDEREFCVLRIDEAIAPL